MVTSESHISITTVRNLTLLEEVGTPSRPDIVIFYRFQQAVSGHLASRTLVWLTTLLRES